jgi:hypothetical protein
MKNLFITIVTVTALFTLGCQDNTITDPVQTDSIEKRQECENYKPGFIPLEGMLNDPYPIGNSYYKISGQIEYYTLASSNQSIQVSKRYVLLHLTVNADLQYYCTVCSPQVEDELAGFISNESQDYLILTDNSLTFLEKSFVILGREDDMVLKCRIVASNGEIELSSMWLELSNNPDIATNEITN